MSQKILIADDDLDIREMLGNYSSRESYEMLNAADMMPNMDGYRMLAEDINYMASQLEQEEQKKTNF